MRHINDKWTVKFHDDFYEEFSELSDEVTDELLAYARLLEKTGPQLARPYADTLNGSKYKNMKELRFKAEGGVWRVAFAFDPKQQAILLVAGDKSGVKQKCFYKGLITKADSRFSEWLEQLKKDKG